MTRFFFLLALFLFLPTLALAQPTPDPANIPALQAIKAEGKDLSYDYVGRYYGLDAWLISGRGVMQMVYSMPENGAAIVGGLLIAPDGKEGATKLQQEFAEKNPERAQEILTQATAQTTVKTNENPSPAAPNKAEKLWQDMGGLGIVPYGPEVGPMVFAVLDPAQPESRRTWLELYKWASEGRIRLNVVPLALVSADNVMTIAQVLGAEDAAQSWRDLMDNKIEKLPPSPDPKGVEGLQKNTTFAQSLKLYQLPFLVYRQGGEASGKIRAVRGLPKDWNRLAGEMGLDLKAAMPNESSQKPLEKGGN